ncbi:MAG TPA: MG2 domain-containing protein, partial [Bacteroidia bacterium]|nr:MG2 domain-containing protein [Bacteroidia bacterium]
MNKLFPSLIISFFVFTTLSAQQSDPYYKEDWNKVAAYAKMNLSRSAVAKADSIYHKAKKAKNTPEVIKAIITMMAYDYAVSDSANEKWIYRIQSEIKTAGCPEKQLLSSLLAEMYWSYYGKNRYRFYNRTQTVNFNNNDISTWDVTKIIDAAIQSYKASLTDADSLQKIDISKFDVILEKGNSRKLRPTLFDFLAHRALGFFESSEPDITRPAVQFNLNDSSYLANYSVFLKINCTSADTLSNSFYAIKTLQQLIAFHATGNNAKDIAPLIDADIERLSFIHANAVNISNRDSLYLQALRVLKAKFISDSTSTDVDYQIALFYYQNSSYNAALPNGRRWFRKKALEICGEAMHRFPQSFGALECRQLEMGIKAKYTTFSLPQVNIPGKPFVASLQFQNMDKAYIRIIKVNPEKYENENWVSYGGQLPKEWAAAIPVSQWSVDLPKESDYQNHSAEIKMPALSPGFYVVLESPNNKFTCDKNLVAYRHFWVSNISYTMRMHTDGSREVTVLDRTDGKPMKNVHAQVLFNGVYDYTGNYYKLVKGPAFTTNEDGSFTVHPRKEHYDDFKLDLTTGTDRFLDFEANSLYDNRYTYKKEIQQVSYFFTDRAIYRPGQTIYFKGILLKTDGDKSWIDSNQSTEVVLYDVNYQKVSSLTLTSDAYGSVSGTFVLPLGLLNGSMRITDGSGTKYIQVEDYKRPKFYVNNDTVKGNFRLGETIKITGVAKGYNGAAIDGATAKYRIVRQENIPWWYSYYWGRYNPSGAAATEIANGSITTN